VIKSLASDRRLIFTSAFLRSAAVGLSGVILALHIARLGFNPLQIGATISLGLAGCAAGTWLVAYFADHKGRRASLSRTGRQRSFASRWRRARWSSSRA